MTSFCGFNTLESRLASFSKPFTKKRTSSAKGTKWPHQRPTPEELSRAGFIFRPTAVSPDNVTCFFCRKDLEGWESGDDALEEHTVHSPDCAYAMHINLERAIPTDHDPLSSSMKSSRTNTFRSWPHTKRGWKCRAEAVAAAGFFFCPTKSSNDFVKCVYCGLGLDGWRSTDDPMHEHLTKAPSCTFVVQSRSRAVSTSPRSSPGYLATTQVSRARSDSASSTKSTKSVISTKSTKSVKISTTKSTKSPLVISARSSRPQSPSPTAGWKPSDFERFLDSLQITDRGSDALLSQYEKEMSTKDWILHRAAEEEAALNRECEERAAFFDMEARRAIAALETLPTSD